jgi:hypothetical protein
MPTTQVSSGLLTFPTVYARHIVALANMDDRYSDIARYMQEFDVRKTAESTEPLNSNFMLFNIDCGGLLVKMDVKTSPSGDP